MAQREALKDPADEGKAEREAKKAEKEMRAFDIENLTLEDFKQLEEKAARTPGPFDGYPLKEKIKIGETEVSRTFVVALSPRVFVQQDPSGHGQTIVTDVRDDQGDKAGKVEKIVNLDTFHSRLIVDYEQGQQNTDVVFDREVRLKNGVLNVAVVPSHSVRAQLMFQLHRKGGIRVDTRYVLLDPDQSSRLRRMFEIIINPKLKIERVARSVSGESEEPLEEIPE